jgi:hypothetical protein
MTIKELNSKWWYRLVKVVCIICALLLIIIGSIIIYFGVTDNKTLDYKQTLITCTKSGMSVPLQDVSKKIEDYKVPIPSNALQAIINKEQPTYFDIFALYLAATPVNPNASDAFNQQFQALCSTDIVVMKDGSQKVIPYDTVTNMDLTNVSTVDGKPLDYEKTTPRLPIDFFSIPFNSYKIFIVTENHIAKATSFIALWILAILVIFEAIRRTFYYIVLGSFKPKK